MNRHFFEDIIDNHKDISKMASSNEIKLWTKKTISIMFPEFPAEQIHSLDKVQESLNYQKKWLVKIFNIMEKDLPRKPEDLANNFFYQLPKIYKLLKSDVNAMYRGDPAARSSLEIIRAYPGFVALSFHRIAHEMYNLQIPMIPRIISESAHAKSGIDIHPGAQIGENCHIDHGTGIVIGETAIVGMNVKLYQGVTLGALSVNKNLQDKKRHPTIEDGVVIYSGATILGGGTVVGHHSVLGGNVWLTESVPPYTKIFHRPQIEINKKIAPEISHSIQHLIGNTPIVEIKHIYKNPNVRIFAKLEGQNPGGSVKDRAAYNMVLQATRRGQIKPGMKLIEPTSGNTGIALAMIACMFNLEIELVMPENSTAQRIQMMQGYGAKVTLTPSEKGLEGSRDYAEEKVAKGGYKILNQFSNPDNYLAHYDTTGPQIWRDTQANITHFVSSMGTTGTIMGTSMYLKEQNQDIKIIGVQPTENSKISGIRRWSPEYLPKIYDPKRVDEIIDVSQEESERMAVRLAKEQAIFAGVSSGGAMCATLKLAQKLDKGFIVFVVCDRGDRYLSSGIFNSAL